MENVQENKNNENVQQSNEIEEIHLNKTNEHHSNKIQFSRKTRFHPYSTQFDLFLLFSNNIFSFFNLEKELNIEMKFDFISILKSI